MAAEWSAQRTLRELIGLHSGPYACVKLAKADS